MILFIVSLPSSYQDVKETLRYSSTALLRYEDVKSTLLVKEEIDFEVHSNEKAEGLFDSGGLG